jgi:hypothetical protein
VFHFGARSVTVYDFAGEEQKVYEQEYVEGPGHRWFSGRMEARRQKREEQRQKRLYDKVRRDYAILHWRASQRHM